MNSVFLEDAQNHPLNRLKIDGERPRLPSNTEYIDMSFAILTGNTIAQFTNLVCKTNENGDLTKNNQERYELDPIKLKSIQEKCFAAYGILSIREQLIK